MKLVHKLNFTNKKPGNLWLPGFLLILLSGCNGCCNSDEPYKIVSNTHGEIQKIIICSFSSGSTYRIYYEELIKAIPERKVVGISYTMPADPYIIRRMHAQNPQLPENFKEVLKLHMDSADYLSLQAKYDTIIDFEDFTNGKDVQTIISDTLKKEFENDVAQRVIKSLKKDFNKIAPPISIIPEISVTIDYWGKSFHFFDSEPETETGDYTWWVQDVCHALQKFCYTTDVHLVYSNASPAHVNTIAKFKEWMPYIQTTETNYLTFDGGNVLPSENYALVGNNIFNDNQYDIPPDELKARLKTLFNVEHIIPTGMITGRRIPGREVDDFERYQPIFHLDMFLTPAGKKGDNNLIFRGWIDKDLYQPGVLTETQIEIINSINALIDTTVENIKLYQEAHPDMPEFEFDSLPLFVKFGTASESAENTTYAWPSFNNCIIEITSDSQKVYLPDYNDMSYIDFETAKQIVVRKFESVGYDKVKFLGPPVDDLNEGALHCYTKIIWRSKE